MLASINARPRLGRMSSEQREQTKSTTTTNRDVRISTMSSSAEQPSTSRPRTLLSRYLIGDDDDDNVHHSVTTRLKSSIDEQFEQAQRDELSCIQVISPRVDSMPAFGGASDAMGALRHMRRNSINSEPNNNNNNNNNNKDDNPTLPSQATANIWSDDTIGSGTAKRSQYRITFEIIKARIVFDGNHTNPSKRSRYVSYTILVKRIPGLDSHPAVIERRYSDFHAFHSTIKRRFPALLKEVPFPPKIFLGNFSPEIIANRCLAFKAFLSFCLSVGEIRSSREFANFLYFTELREAKRLLTAINLEEAGFIFENVYHSQEKLVTLAGQPTAQFVHTACCLVGCYNAIDNRAEARIYAERIFEILFEQGETVAEVRKLFESVDLVLPLILLSLRLRWFSAARKVALENKAEELCRLRGLPRNFDSQPSLLERLLKKDFQPILDS